MNQHEQQTLEQVQRNKIYVSRNGMYGKRKNTANTYKERDTIHINGIFASFVVNCVYHDNPNSSQVLLLAMGYYWDKLFSTF